jgi:hypothetical protein
MSEAEPNPELLGSLGRLVRGLSALFWGLPIALVASVWTANPHWLKTLYMVPVLASNAMLVYGVWLLGSFQKQERVWRGAVDRALLLSIVNFGLSPFLYWYSVVPSNEFFTVMIVLDGLCWILLLGGLNFVLQRLGAMLPDEALRSEIKQFTPLNVNLLAVTLALGAFWFCLTFFKSLPEWLNVAAKMLERGSFWFLVPLILLPLAMTMALLWKTKEVILDSVFGSRR